MLRFGALRSDMRRLWLNDMQKNCEYEGLVEGLGTDGEGIIKCEGATVFVPFCLVGEKVRFKVLKAKNNIAYGKLTEVLTPSAERVKPPCPVFGKCGGCQLQHASYAYQTEFKRLTVKNALNKIGGIDCEVSPCVPCEKSYGYRNKMSVPIGEDGVGFYALHSHRIVPIKTCAIEKEWAADVIKVLNGYMQKSGLKGADGEGGLGDLRHFVVREIKDNFIFALAATHTVNTAILVDLLKEKFEKFTLLLNINSGGTNAIFGDRWKCVYGGGFFVAEENGVKYKAGANTFLQVNDGVRDELYKKVISEADGDAVVIDAYSGGGMLTAMLAKRCKKAYGIEVVKEAVNCADELKELNGLSDKMQNICGKVENEIDGVLKTVAGEKLIAVCDPPRKGMERSVVYALKKTAAEKIILISCNPSTLARDLGLFLGTLKEIEGQLVKCAPSEEEPYYIESVTPYDMFPQTKHVETLCVLKRKISYC